jgi:hypothetical protein
MRRGAPHLLFGFYIFGDKKDGAVPSTAPSFLLSIAENRDKILS